MYLQDGEAEFRTQTRPTSAIHIRLYKTTPHTHLTTPTPPPTVATASTASKTHTWTFSTLIIACVYIYIYIHAVVKSAITEHSVHLYVYLVWVLTLTKITIIDKHIYIGVISATYTEQTFLAAISSVYTYSTCVEFPWYISAIDTVWDYEFVSCVFSDAWDEVRPVRQSCCSSQQNCETPGCPSPI